VAPPQQWRSGGAPSGASTGSREEAGSKGNPGRFGWRSNQPFVDEALRRRSSGGILEACEPHLAQFSVADSLKVLQALTRVPDKNIDRIATLQRLAAHVVRIGCSDAVVEPSHLAKIAWALAKLSVADAPLMSAIAESARPRLKEAVVLDLVNFAWAYAASRCCDQPLLDAIAEEVSVRITQFDPRSLANTVWAYAKLGMMNGPFLAAISSASMNS